MFPRPDSRSVYLLVNVVSIGTPEETTKGVNSGGTDSASGATDLQMNSEVATEGGKGRRGLHGGDIDVPNGKQDEVFVLSGSLCV